MFHRAQQHPHGYTNLDNGFLRNEYLSLKARGLLATILSFPDSWQFSIRGLEKILHDGRTAIEGAVKELEQAGHIVRLPQGRGEDGRMLPAVWEIYERPILNDPEMRGPPPTDGQNGTSAQNQQVVSNSERDA